MYTRSVAYYDLLYGFKDYAAASDYIYRTVTRQHPEAKALLDVGCGTGLHLEHLARWYSVEGLDVNPDLLEVARGRCPSVPFHQADMTDFSIPRTFDVVTCLFSSIAYVKDVARMRAAVASMRRHLRPGGVIVIEPWFTPEAYWTDTITANLAESDDAKIAWMYTSTTEAGVAVLNIHYLLGRDGEVEHFTERHELGLFTGREYRAALEAGALEVMHDPEGPFGRGLYLGVDR